jgi:hypothetical protein
MRRNKWKAMVMPPASIMRSGFFAGVPLPAGIVQLGYSGHKMNSMFYHSVSFLDISGQPNF